MQIEVPVKNPDGSIMFTTTLNEKETQAILQFGINMALGMGILSQLIPSQATNLPMEAPEHVQ